MCKPSAADGVIVSMGDATDGFSLYLRGGVAHFAVRTNGVLHEVSGTRPLDLDQWVHVAGAIGDNGGLSLLVDAWTEGEATGPPTFLTGTPAGPFAVGADAGTTVGTYAAALHGQGLVEDVRLYRGRSAARHTATCWATGAGSRRGRAGPSRSKPQTRPAC
jgi:hypothetical protein